MMLSIPNRAAACCAALMMSGCMQSMPTAEMITRPTQEAFTRLTSWTPWRTGPQPEPLILRSELPPPVAPEPAAEPVVRRDLPLRTPSAAPLLRREPAPAMAATRRPAPARIVPVADTVSMPGKLTCRTASEPGQRVRMECLPVE